MLDNSLKPTLKLKFPPSRPSASTPTPVLATPAKTAPPVPEAKKERFKLTYLHADGREWGAPRPPPKRRKPSQLRYRAKKLAARKEGWISIVCGMFVERVDGDRDAAVAFAEAHRGDVRDAFDHRLAKADAVVALLEIYAAIQ